jgi:hypothetical protein
MTVRLDQDSTPKIKPDGMPLPRIRPAGTASGSTRQPFAKVSAGLAPENCQSWAARAREPVAGVPDFMFVLLRIG